MPSNAVKAAFKSVLDEIDQYNMIFPPKTPKTLDITFLGGQDGIGRANCQLISLKSGGNQLLVDCGRQTAENDLIHLPNFRLINFDKLVGVIITHGHLDHCGAIVELIDARDQKPGREPLQVFGTTFTFRIIRKIIDNSGRPELYNRIRLIEAEPIFMIGGFLIGSFPIIHSIPGALCYLVEAGEKKVCILADFKFIDTDMVDFAETEGTFQLIGQHRPNLLLIDATGINNDDGFTPSMIGSLSEIDRILRGNPDRRVFISTFASNIQAIARMAVLANNAGRPVEYFGTSMSFSFESSGILSGSDQSLRSLYFRPPVVFVTGCQAEAGAVLPALARTGRRDSLALRSDDLIIIPTRRIPTNDKRISEMVSGLRYRDIEVITCLDKPKIHVSGHGAAADMKAAIRAISPAQVVGIHNNLTACREVKFLLPAGQNIISSAAKNGETISV